MISQRGGNNPGRREPTRVVTLVRIFFAVSLVFSSVKVNAAQWQTDPFLKSVQGTFFDLNYLNKGLKSVNSITFKNDPINQYQRFFNRIILSSTMGDGANRIREITRLNPIDLGTLAHEAFHAYKANFLETKREFDWVRSWMRGRSKIIFDDLSSEKAAVALEEAYAVFIGEMATAKIQFSKMIQRPSDKSCEERLNGIERLWDVNWSSEVKGYYYRDGIGEYWADQAKALWTLVSEGSKAYAQLKNADGAIYVEQKLPMIDKQWIGIHIFENRIKKSFKGTFETELKAIGCYDSIR